MEQDTNAGHSTNLTPFPYTHRAHNSTARVSFKFMVNFSLATGSAANAAAHNFL